MSHNAITLNYRSFFQIHLIVRRFHCVWPETDGREPAVSLQQTAREASGTNRLTSG
ncbi:hypothetical protein V1278_001421 [Bradyrhizobium sp. AZCC 1577]